MKKNLFLAAVIAVTALTFFGCQDPIKDLTLKPGSAPEVDATTIKAEVIKDATDAVDGILVSWGISENYGGYTVWRQEIKDKEPVEGTAVNLLNPPNNNNPPTNIVYYTSSKKLPYFIDTTAKAGVTYQYGIVSSTYKNGNGDVAEISDIVWQDVGEGAYVTGPAKETDVKKVDKNPTKPKVTITPVTASTDFPVAGWAQNPDYFLVKVEGLTYGYTYTFAGQSTTNLDGTGVTQPWGSAWNGQGSSIQNMNDNNLFQPVVTRADYINQKLEKEDPVYYARIPNPFGSTRPSGSGSTTYAVRVVAAYGVQSPSRVLTKTQSDPATAAAVKAGLGGWSNYEELVSESLK